MERKHSSKRKLPEYGYPTANIAELSEKAAEVTRRLTREYGELPFPNKDPMSMLVDILLSHRTRDEQTAAAYDTLLQRFGSWEAVRDAPTEQVQVAIANVNFPEVKAPRIQAVLRQITAELGRLNLDFLCNIPLTESVAWLNRFEGIGPKTTACVLLFSCQRALLPVDVHVARTSMCLGLIGKSVSAEAAHTLLQALLPQEARPIYNFHKALLRHGQRICVFGRPRCERCILTDICDFYRFIITE